jgi:hypothetical protein
MSKRAFPPAAAVAAAMLMLVLAVAGCGKSDKGDARKDVPATVTTTRVQPQPWQDSLQALGTAQARNACRCRWLTAIRAAWTGLMAQVALLGQPLESGVRIQMA